MRVAELTVVRRKCGGYAVCFGELGVCRLTRTLTETSRLPSLWTVVLEEERRSAPNRTLAGAIAGVARGALAGSFRVRVEWARAGRMVLAELYGNDDAAIWNDERAFRVVSAEIGATAKALSDVGSRRRRNATDLARPPDRQSSGAARYNSLV